MGRKKQDNGAVVEYANRLRNIMPIVATESRFPKLAQYEYQVAKEIEHEKMKEYVEKGKEPEDAPKYTARSVHTQVWRAMQYLVERKEAKKIGRCYYPIGEEEVMMYEKLLKNIRLASPQIYIISRYTIAISIESGQPVDRIKSALKSCLGEDFLVGSIVQDDTVLILLSPQSPAALLAEFMSWVKDAYKAQHSKRRK